MFAQLWAPTGLLLSASSQDASSASGAGPSTSMAGMSRSSQLGIHQFLFPGVPSWPAPAACDHRRVEEDGRGQPCAEDLDHPRVLEQEAAENHHHDGGRRRDPVAASPSATEPFGSPVWLSTATKNGPLNPGPNPSATRSYARRAVVPSPKFPSSEKPRRMLSAGAARRNNSVPPTNTLDHG